MPSPTHWPTRVAQDVARFERDIWPWLWMWWGNLGSMALAQWVLAPLWPLALRSVAYFYLMWCLHGEVPLPPGLAGARVDLAPRTTLERARLWLGRGVTGVALAGALVWGPWWLITVKVGATAWRHHLHLRRRWPDPAQRWTRRTWAVRHTLASVLSLGLGVGLFLWHRHAQDPTQAAQPRHAVVLGLVYPAVRHVARVVLAYLVGDPTGRHRPCRLWVQISVDLPLYVMLYAQETLGFTWAVVCGTTAVDVVAAAWWWTRPSRRLFTWSTAVWLQLVALAAVLTLWPAEERLEHVQPRTVDLTERLLFAWVYVLALGLAPGLLWHGAAAVRAWVPEWQRRRRGGFQPLSPLPVPAPPMSTTRLRDLEPDVTYRSVQALWRVASQLDAVCFMMNAVALATVPRHGL